MSGSKDCRCGERKALWKQYEKHKDTVRVLGVEGQWKDMKTEKTAIYSAYH